MVRCIVLLNFRGSLRWLPVVGFVFLWMVGPGAGCATAIVFQNGIWINDSGSGTWEDADTGSWQDGIVATGSGGTADFSTFDITKDDTVSLGAARTIGNLVFGDATTPSNNWILDYGVSSSNILTLSAVAPSIDVKNQTATISASIAGTNGLNLTGAGTLVLERHQFIRRRNEPRQQRIVAGRARQSVGSRRFDD